jgi:hypothetical protein
MRLFVVILFLAACIASPAPMMMGAQKVTVTVGGHAYAVWRRDKAFEVVRMGYAKRAEQPAIKATMLAVVAQVTGCTPHVDTGDSGEMRGTLSACR